MTTENTNTVTAKSIIVHKASDKGHDTLELVLDQAADLIQEEITQKKRWAFINGRPVLLEGDGMSQRNHQLLTQLLSSPDVTEVTLLGQLTGGLR